MLCSRAELGLGTFTKSLFRVNIAPGQNIWNKFDQVAGKPPTKKTTFPKQDASIYFDLTPNRSDCLAMRNCASELLLFSEKTPQRPKEVFVSPKISDLVEINLDNPKACPIYCGRIIKKVDIGALTPQWMLDRLRASQIGSINIVVDITNYVLLEMGQPMHAFDLHKLRGKVIVRNGRKGESLTLLNNQKLELTGNELVIADAESAVALAGIMGGKRSAISHQKENDKAEFGVTEDIFLESAFFQPEAVKGIARNLGLNTAAAKAYEHGIDFEMQEQAIEYATQLICDLAGGLPGPTLVERREEFIPKRKTVSLGTKRIHSLLGVNPKTEFIVNVLKKQGFHCSLERREGAETVSCLPPSSRYDINCEADLVEEVARFFGFNNIPPQKPEIQDNLGLQYRFLQDVQFDRSLRSKLVSWDLKEVISYTFMEDPAEFLVESNNAVKLLNPMLPSQDFLRNSLFPGLFKALLHNWMRNHRRVRLFECGKTFHFDTEKKIKEESKTGVLICGLRMPEFWGETDQEVDFFDIKGIAESLYYGDSGRVDWVPCKKKIFEKGHAANLMINQQLAGFAGKLSPELEAKLGVNRVPIYYVEVDNGYLTGEMGVKPSAEENQTSRIDFSFLMKESISSKEVISLVKSVVGDLFHDIVIFDLFRGKGIPEGKKSLSFGLFVKSKSNNPGKTPIFNLITDAMRDKLSAEKR